MNLLFLDIDGVLNNHRQQVNGYCGIDQHCMTNLNYVINQTDCGVVISSAWRYMIPDGMNILGFEYLLKTHGCLGKVIGVTDRDEVIQRREDQIRAYVNNWSDKWAVVDDLPLQIENFVRTDGNIGLQQHEAEKLIQILAH